MVHIFVVTGGYRSIVYSSLKNLGLSRYVRDVVTPATILMKEGGPGPDITDMLRHVKSTQGLRKILLVDHHHNVAAARRAGFWGHIVDHRQGIVDQDTEAVRMKLAREGGVDAVFVGVDNVLFEGHMTAQYIYNVLANGRLSMPPEVKLSPGARFFLKTISS